MHPLYDLLKTYTEEFDQLKEVNQSIHTYSFNKQFGLSISTPQNWPVREVIYKIISESVNKKVQDVVFVYSMFEDCRYVAQMVENDHLDCGFNPVNWHQIYVAMRRTQEDVRFLSAIREKLEKAGLVVVLGENDITPDVIDQIRSATEGCLLLVNCN